MLSGRERLDLQRLVARFRFTRIITLRGPPIIHEAHWTPPGDAVTCASTGWPMLVGARGSEDDEGAVYIYAGPDDAAPVIVQPPASSVDHVEFGYSVAYASGKFVVGAREIGADKIGAAFLYTL